MQEQYNISSQLNEQQIEMLRLFKMPMPQQDYEKIKQLVVQLLASEIDGAMDNLAQEKGWTNDTYEQWGREHMRTPYKK